MENITALEKSIAAIRTLLDGSRSDEVMSGFLTARLHMATQQLNEARQQQQSQLEEQRRINEKEMEEQRQKAEQLRQEQIRIQQQKAAETQQVVQPWTDMMIRIKERAETTQNQNILPPSEKCDQTWTAEICYPPSLQEQFNRLQARIEQFMVGAKQYCEQQQIEYDAQCKAVLSHGLCSTAPINRDAMRAYSAVAKLVLESPTEPTYEKEEYDSGGGSGMGYGSDKISYITTYYHTVVIDIPPGMFPALVIPLDELSSDVSKFYGDRKESQQMEWLKITQNNTVFPPQIVVRLPCKPVWRLTNLRGEQWLWLAKVGINARLLGQRETHKPTVLVNFSSRVKDYFSVFTGLVNN